MSRIYRSGNDVLVWGHGVRRSFELHCHTELLEARVKLKLKPKVKPKMKPKVKQMHLKNQ